MKKIMMGILVAICAIACNKFNSEVPSSSVDGIKFNLNATPASLSDKSRATLGDDNKWSWKAGDKIWVLHPRTDKIDGVDQFSGQMIFTYGEDGKFTCETLADTWSGNIAAEAALETWVAFSQYDKMQNDKDVTGGIHARPIVPEAQDGTLECVGENFFMYSVNRYFENSVGVSYDEASQAVNVNVKFKGCTMPIVKFNVPETLGATEIVLSGIDNEGNPSILAGQVNVFRTTHDRDYVNKTTGLPDFKILDGKESITISRDGDVISGDVYVLLQSDVMYDAAARHTNSAVKLKFDITTEDGSISGTKKLNTTLTGGIITDLGTINPPSSGQLNPPVISYDLESGKVIATTKDDGCTLYYCIKDTPSKPDNYQEIPTGGFDFTKGAVNYIHVKSSKSGYQNGVAQAVIKHWDSGFHPTVKTYLEAGIYPVYEGSWLNLDVKCDIQATAANIVFKKVSESVGQKIRSGDLAFDASSTGTATLYLNTGSSTKVVYVAINGAAGVNVGQNTNGGFDKMNAVSVKENDSIRVYFSGSSNCKELLWLETGSFTVLDSVDQNLNSPGFNNNGGQNL